MQGRRENSRWRKFSARFARRRPREKGEGQGAQRAERADNFHGLDINFGKLLLVY